EVFVRPMQGEGKWQASVAGGSQPVWSRDGRTLFYRDEKHFVAATVGVGTAFNITERHDFAEDRFAGENTINYDVMPDGKRLVVVVPSDQGVQLNIIVNWMEEVRQRMAAKK